MSAPIETPPPREPPLRVLPRGRHAAPREVVAESQRERMLVAIADAVAEKGYGAVAVADVIERAGVSRRTFYEHFANKEACFLAAYDAGVEGMLAELAAAPGPREATETYLGLLADNPAFARAFLVEVHAAGPAALARRAAVHERFAQLLADGRREALGTSARPEPPAAVYRAAVGAIHELVIDHVLREGAATLPELAGALLEVELRLLA